MQRTLEYAELAAQQDGIVLLLGESGTGKDWFSRYIHARSRRSSGPFFDINCAALPRELAESELFGHEPGAFTGTRGRKRGLLELAENGTLLLNEVGELDLQLQSKLLTFLDTRTFLRVGGEKPTTVNARIFAATNRDLLVEVDKGRFRSDLYYRLNVFPIQVPALRERLDDLPALVEELLVKLQGEMGLPEAPRLGVGVLEALRSYGWPGNIRELRNVLERTLILSGGVELKREHLALQAGGGDWRLVVGFEPGRSLHEVTEQVARQLIGEALRRSRTRQDAARLLGLSRHALAYQMRTLGLEE
jgi:transcriptional regulator with PAS, ATPase and Fis domain